MSVRAFDILHEEMARPHPGVTFILCCDDQEQIPAKTRGLFYPLALQARSLKAQTDYLSFLCNGEKINFEPDALDLLCEYTGSSFRDLARDLEVLISRGNVTVQSVEYLFGRKPSARYVNLVFERESFARQISFLNEWKASAPDKIRQIGDLLSALFRLHQGGTALDRIGISQCLNLAAGLEKCLANLKEQPSLFARKLLETWDPEPAMGPTTLLRKASEFEDLVGGVSIGDQESTSDITARWQASDERRQRYGREAKRTVKTASKQFAETVTTDFLGLDEAKGLWHAASFMVQQYGALLNTRLTIRHNHLRPHKKGGPEQHLTDFGRELRELINRTKTSTQDHLHWLYIHQNDPREGLITRIVAHLPPCKADIPHWILHRFFKRRALAVGSDFPVDVDLRQKEKPLSVHHSLIRELCAGLAPSDSANLAFFHRTKTDAERLGWIPGPKLTFQRKGVSRLIDLSSQQRAEQDLTVINALDTPNVDVCSGWELAQYAYRKGLIEAQENLEREAERYENSELRLNVLKQRWEQEKVLREIGRPAFS
jgi:hypothetical protein